MASLCAPKFSMVLNSSRHSCRVCGLNGIKKAKAFLFAIYSHARPPFSCLFMKRNPFNSGGAISASARVLAVLRFSCLSQVASRVVHAVRVNMVNLKSLGFAHKRAVQINLTRFSAAVVYPICIDSPWHHLCRPIVAAGQEDIIRVNDGGVSLCKRDMGDLALNANWSYVFSHLAGSFRWFGRVEPASSPPVFIAQREIGGKQ